MNKNMRYKLRKDKQDEFIENYEYQSQEDLITKYMFLEQQCKKQKEVIDKLLDILKEVSE